MKRIFWPAWLLMLSIAACSTTGHETPEMWRRPLLAGDAESLLLYYEWTHRASPARLAREVELTQQAFARSNSDFDRLRCAIALSVPGAASSDIPHALELLEPVANNAATPLHSIAFLLQSQLSEQRRLDASAAELRQKLDALKALEKNMSERGAGAK